MVVIFDLFMMIDPVYLNKFAPRLQQKNDDFIMIKTQITN